MSFVIPDNDQRVVMGDQKQQANLCSCDCLTYRCQCFVERKCEYDERRNEDCSSLCSRLRVLAVRLVLPLDFTSAVCG